MLFNSYVFLFAFLPVTLAGFFLASRVLGRQGAILWLVAASLFYYGWWNPAYLGLILASMAVNFALGRAIAGAGERGGGRSLLAAGIAFNLGLLGYFKYANFLADSVAAATGAEVALAPIVLPLAISFFTFQQIAFLVDARQGAVAEYDLGRYALFVTFFPQLIAGPIVHHREMMPQFRRDAALTPRARNFAVGGTIFAIGLFKKVVLADGVAAYATPVFDAARDGAALTLLEAWGGALAYTLQLYFDFSGYSDMAIGAARLFGIRLPLNFFSPYKAVSITAFWRRWHMTLSRFLRDYLYIPLGGNRKGPARRYGNLMITMVLGGLWHGAGWTFVLWGALHGVFLVVNLGWDRMWRGLGGGAWRAGAAWRTFAWALTFLAVVVAWVLFRADSLEAALGLWRGMAGLNGIALPEGLVARLGGFAGTLQGIGIGTFAGGSGTFILNWLWVGVLLVLAIAAPNTAQLMRAYRPTVDRYAAPLADGVAPFGGLAGAVRWRPTAPAALSFAAVAAVAVLGLGRVSEFLYFQF